MATAAKMSRKTGGSVSSSVGARAKRILIVDDDRSVCAALSMAIAEDGYETMTASSGAAALDVAKKWLPDLIITDVMMPNMTGIELCRAVHELDPDLPVIITTGLEHSEAGLECLRAGAEDYLSKPIHLAAVSWSMRRALERLADKRERQLLAKHTDELCEQLQTANERLLVSSIRVRELAQTEMLKRAELNALLEGLGEGILIVDATGAVRMMNDAARSILGVESVPPTSQALDAVLMFDLHGAQLTAEQHPVGRALRGDVFADYEVAYAAPDGQPRRVMATATNVKDKDGAVTSAIIILHDVTQLRRLEQQREEFSALTSHDLRNPLSVICLSAQLLHESLSEKQLIADVGNVTRIERNANEMVAMLEELTEVARLESQRPAPLRRSCDLSELAANVVARLDETSARRVTIETGDDSPSLVLADAAQLERCITNLVTNALKYSAKDAPVVLRFGRSAREVELDVVDHGIGIDPDCVKHVFDRYFRTVSGTRRAEGLGLGLYIVRLIVDAHGGRIDVASEVGKGSTFKLALPLDAATS
jgi:PAS domain S-box-containing protein